jgi:uncharacterized protein
MQELVKQYHMNNEIDEIIDFGDDFDVTDLISLSPVHVSGDFEVYDNKEFIFYLNLKCTMTLPCARTLEEVEYPIDLDVEEVFSLEPSEESNLIDGITIDLLPIIWSNIILEKPMRVVSKKAEENFELDNTEFEEEDTNEAFALLKNYKK